ncbi:MULTISPECIES: DUF433 domain-containing protein [Micromonospora]|uniref:Uncharacterized conserved protein, DUF433 family n=1 Tax=Micromonospora haikouensis TaxID=686309 RepID=A0A1C4V6R0_9ACTN|nr:MULTISPECIES: DUF433 domain-containing protein [Micromonospora]MDI5939221.1 DUF433 domain-containing protein [Micromonospora sp. DH15]OON30385.1 DUF433 domain-containing protein [Micromonospora sp. Rc5]SCE79637.1 Uncharacterized conserved protein, DUF433 family [Micromonospora haikouensis]
MIDKVQDALLTPSDTARYLGIPRSTMHSWLAEKAAGAPLVHTVPPVKRGWPSVPFVAVIEAYVLRSLRELKLGKDKIRDAAAEIRNVFGNPYGLADRRIATDGIDVFVHYVDTDELARAGDRQMPIREVISDYLNYIVWEPSDAYPARLRLRQYPDTAQVVIDPRFGWGAPVVARNKVPVEAVVGMWRAGESSETVADEYGLTVDEVEAVVRVAA